MTLPSLSEVNNFDLEQCYSNLFGHPNNGEIYESNLAKVSDSLMREVMFEHFGYEVKEDIKNPFPFFTIRSEEDRIREQYRVLSYINKLRIFVKYRMKYGEKLGKICQGQTPISLGDNATVDDLFSCLTLLGPDNPSKGIQLFSASAQQNINDAVKDTLPDGTMHNDYHQAYYSLPAERRSAVTDATIRDYVVQALSYCRSQPINGAKILSGVASSWNGKYEDHISMDDEMKIHNISTWSEDLLLLSPGLTLGCGLLGLFTLNPYILAGIAAASFFTGIALGMAEKKQNFQFTDQHLYKDPESAILLGLSAISLFLGYRSYKKYLNFLSQPTPGNLIERMFSLPIRKTSRRLNVVGCVMLTGSSLGYIIGNYATAWYLADSNF